MQTATQQLAAFVAALEHDDLPQAVVSSAKLHVLDALGCGIAAYALDTVPWVTAAHEPTASGVATAIGVPGRLAPEAAALVNGTLFHALDYDDTHPDARMHVSAVVVPAALAVGELLGAGGHDILTAIVAGNETAVRLGSAARGRFHARGFHPTSVCGVFGAAAAAARLRGLDPERTTHALGIAASMASGLIEFLADGAQTKPLHAGWAAQAGITAARLASHGATGPASALDGRRGLFAAYLYGEPDRLAAELADLGARWATRDIAYKPYPSCRATHAPLGALDGLIHEHRLDPYDVTSIVAISDEAGTGLTLLPLEHKRRPRTPDEAKTSLPYCLAALLIHGHVGVESFTEEAITNPAVLDLAGRVTGEIRHYPPARGSMPGGVRVSSRYGRTVEADLLYPRGGTENPMTRDEIVAKWRANAKLALSPAQLSDLENAILGLEHEPELSPLAIASDMARARGVAQVS